MSLPAIATGSIAGVSAIAASPLDSLLHVFSNNPYFVGIMMLLLNIGGRFITLEITKQQELFLQRPWVRRVLIFTVIFVATRNIQIAFWATVIAVLFLGYLFNENSALCIFGKGGANGAACAGVNSPMDSGMSPEEKEILQRLSAKAQRYVTTGNANDSTMNPQQAALKAAGKPSQDDADVPHMDVYAANLSLLQR